MEIPGTACKALAATVLTVVLWRCRMIVQASVGLLIYYYLLFQKDILKVHRDLLSIWSGLLFEGDFKDEGARPFGVIQTGTDRINEC